MTEILKHAKYALLFSGLETLSVSKLVCFHLFNKCLQDSALLSCMRSVSSTVVHARGLAPSGKILVGRPGGGGGGGGVAHMWTGARI